MQRDGETDAEQIFFQFRSFQPRYSQQAVGSFEILTVSASLGRDAGAGADAGAEAFAWGSAASSSSEVSSSSSSFFAPAQGATCGPAGPLHVLQQVFFPGRDHWPHFDLHGSFSSSVPSLSFLRQVTFREELTIEGSGGGGGGGGGGV